MIDSTFRDFKQFTRERVYELVVECEQNLSECLRLMQTLVEDAKEMTSREIQEKVSKRYFEMQDAAEQVSELLDKFRV